MPPDPWDDVLDTLEIPPACPQPGEGVAYIESHVPGFNSTNEDCLYLNIYSPKVSISCTFTVFSWFFFFNSCHRYLLSKQWSFEQILNVKMKVSTMSAQIFT